MIYYIYEIEGVKVGCSINPERRVRTQKHTKYRIVEAVVGTPWQAKKREDFWKIELGYGPDPSDNYAKMIAMAAKGTAKAALPEFVEKRKQSIKKSSKFQEAVRNNLKKYVTPEIRAINDAKKKISILQFDLANNFIREWAGACDAGKALGVWPGNITAVCKGKANMAGGFIWKYKYI